MKKVHLGTEYWDTFAEKMQSCYVRNPYFQHKQNEVSRLIERWTTSRQHMTILKTDLCEEALEPDSFLFDLAQNNGNIWGIDISSRLAGIANQKMRQRGIVLNISVSDVRRLGLKDSMFDLVISTSTLDHFAEANVALEELYRVLKPNGLIILTLHNKMNPLVYSMYELMRLLGKYPFGYAEGTYSLRDMEQLMRKAGFDVEESTAIIHTPPFLPTLMNEIYRNGNSKILSGACRAVAGLSEMIGKSETPLKYLTGYCLAMKGTKK